MISEWNNGFFCWNDYKSICAKWATQASFVLSGSACPISLEDRRGYMRQVSLTYLKSSRPSKAGAREQLT